MFLLVALNESRGGWAVKSQERELQSGIQNVVVNRLRLCAKEKELRSVKSRFVQLLKGIATLALCEVRFCGSSPVFTAKKLQDCLD